MAINNKKMLFGVRSRVSDQCVPENSALLNYFSYNYTSGECSDINSYQEPNPLLFSPLRVAQTNEPLVFNSRFLYQNNTFESLEQQFASIESNVLVSSISLTSYRYFNLQEEIRPQNNIPSNEFDLPSYYNNNDLFQMPPPSPSQHSETSYFSAYTSIESIERTSNPASPNERNSSNLSSQNFFSHTGYSNSRYDNQGLDECLELYNSSNGFYDNINQYDSNNYYTNNDTSRQFCNNQQSINDNFDNDYQNTINFRNSGTNTDCANYSTQSIINTIDLYNGSSSSLKGIFDTENHTDNHSEQLSSTDAKITKHKVKRIIKKSTNSKATKKRSRLTKEKPKPKCPRCGKKINRQRDLERHLQIHFGLKPFKCNTCLKQFSRKDSLDRHKRAINACQKHKSKKNAKQLQ